MEMLKKDVYSKTVKRLERCGINDPTSQIVFLAEEIEGYREKIRILEGQRTASDNHPIKTEFIFRKWFPKYTSWMSVVEWFEAMLREGWKPCKFEYESAIPRDCNCLVFVLERECENGKE